MGPTAELPLTDSVTSEWPLRSPVRPGRRRNWRTAITVALAVAAIICLFFGNTALWMRQDIYSAANVDRQAQAVIGSTDVQRAVADLLVTKVVQPVLAQSAGQGHISAVIRAPLMGVARRLIDQAVSAEPAQRVATRLVDQVVPELERGTGPISLSAEQMAWILSPHLAANAVVATVVQTADRTGCCRVVLVSRERLPFGWRHTAAIRTAGVVLPAMFAVLGLLALGIARRRLRLAMILAAGATITGVVTLALLWAGPGWWSALLTRPSSAAGIVRAADNAVFHSVTAPLRDHSLLIAGVGACALAVLATVGRLRRQHGDEPGRR